MNNNVEKFTSQCGKMINVQFKKVLECDFFWLGIGAIIWIGLEVFVFGKVIVV